MIMAAMFILFCCGLFWRCCFEEAEAGLGGELLTKIVQLCVAELGFRLVSLPDTMPSRAVSWATANRTKHLTARRVYIYVFICLNDSRFCLCHFCACVLHKAF